MAEGAGAECAPAARVPVTRRPPQDAGSNAELVGLGLRGPHAQELLEQQPTLALLEVHTENYLGGGAPRAVLERVRRDYAVSLHGVGMSLGSVEPLSAEYLANLRQLVREIEPAFVSDHASFSSSAGRHSHDLLPLPYTEEALELLALRVEQAQERLQRRLLVENVSAYVRYPHSTLAEHDFLAALATRTGCGLLLDVNNVYVSSRNLGFDARRYIDGLPPEAVAEMHLGGHTEAGGLLIDLHGEAVQEPVWELLRHALRRFPGVATVIEWDTDLPALGVLLAECDRASAVRAGVLGTRARPVREGISCHSR